MEIRKAAAQDIAWLIEHDAHAGAREWESIVGQNRAYVARADGETAGWLRYGLFWDEIPFMNMLVVLETYRGRGYGRGLVEHWEDEMRRLGHKRVLTSTVSKEYSQHFYARLGYEAVGGFLLPGEPYEIILSKEI